MSFGEFLWSLLVLYFMFFYFMMLFRIIGDLFSDRDTSGWAKTGWIIFLLLVPILALFVYLIARGDGMTERALAKWEAQDAAQKAYTRQAATAADDPTAKIARGSAAAEFRRDHECGVRQAQGEGAGLASSGDRESVCAYGANHRDTGPGSRASTTPMTVATMRANATAKSHPM